MSEKEAPKRTGKPGRPKTARGTATKRDLRIHDDIWGPCRERAEALDMTISEYVRRALVIGMQNDLVATMTAQRRGKTLSSPDLG